MITHRILIVDDSYINRAIIKSVLKNIGCDNFVETSDGATALKFIEEAAGTGVPFDIVFCDRLSPHLDGMNLLIECKKRLELSSLSFVMISDMSCRADVLRALREGANDYLVTPLSYDIIKKKSEVLLRDLEKPGQELRQN